MMRILKGQISIEFMIIFSFILVVFLFLFALITQQRALTQNSQTFSQLQLVAQSLALQINRASQAGTGYSALIPITTNIGNIPYNLSVTKSGIVIVSTKVGTQQITTTAYSNVQSVLSSSLFYGATNSIYVLPITNGSISIQNSFGTVCIDYKCPTTTNQSSSLYLSSQVVKVLNTYYSSSNIQFPVKNSLTQLNGVTISAWVNEKGPWINPDYPNILSGQCWFLRIDDPAEGNHISWFIGTGSPNVVEPRLSSTIVPALNTWYHLVATYNSSTGYMGLYINGALNSHQIRSGTPSTFCGSSIWIGGSNQSIANVQVYNFSLSANQVSALYNEGISGSPTATYNGINLWVPLNGNSNDYSGQGNIASSSGSLIYTTVAQISATVKNPLGRAVNNVLVGFTTTLGNFTNGYGSPGQAIANYTNSNGTVTTFLNQQGTNGQALVKATAFNGNISTSHSVVAWYPLNQGQGSKSYDLSGNRNSGTFVGQQPSWTNPNYAASFYGNGTKIATPLKYAYGTSNAVTITGWVYLTRPPVSFPGAVYIVNSGWTFGLWHDNNLWFFTGGLGNAGAGQLSYNTWYFVTAKISAPVNPTITLYLNGVQVSSASYVGTLESGCGTSLQYYISGPPLAGTTCGATTQTFPGYLSNIQIYNSSLSQAQISQLYASGISSSPLNGQSLAGWWPLNGDANDYSAGNKNATIYGGVSFVPLSPSISPGLIANANASRISVASFSSVDSYINYHKNFTLSSGSVFGWINTTGNNEMILQMQNYTPLIYLEVGNIGSGGNANQLVAYMRNNLGGGTIPWNSNVVVNNNLWHQVGLSWNGTLATLYVDGISTNTIPFYGKITTTNSLTSQLFHLGASGYNGLMSNFQLYSSGLTSAQVLQLYQEGLGGTPIPSGNSLLAWWPLNGNSNDQSFGGINSTLVSNVVYKNVINYIPSLFPSLNYSGINIQPSSYISVTPTPLLEQTTKVTVSVWFNEQSYPNCYPAIGTYVFTQGYSLLLPCATDHGGGITIGNGAEGYISVPSSHWAKLGVWNHMVATYDGSNTIVYLNGAKVASGTYGGPMTYSGVGTIYAPGLPYSPIGTNGLVVSNIQIYNYNLSSSQVQQLYNSGMPPTAAATIPLSWYP